MTRPKAGSQQPTSHTLEPAIAREGRSPRRMTLQQNPQRLLPAAALGR